MVMKHLLYTFSQYFETVGESKDHKATLKTSSWLPFLWSFTMSNSLIRYSIIFTSFKFRIHKSTAISITNCRRATSVHHCLLISAKNTLIARLISNILCKYAIPRPKVHLSQLMQEQYGNKMKNLAILEVRRFRKSGALSCQLEKPFIRFY